MDSSEGFGKNWAIVNFHGVLGAAATKIPARVGKALFVVILRDIAMAFLSPGFFTSLN